MIDRLTLAILALGCFGAGCGVDEPSVDLDAGVRTHLEVTGQTAADVADICGFGDRRDLCGIELLQAIISDRCAANVDDIADQAAWELTAEHVDVQDQLDVMWSACPDSAQAWSAYEASR